MATDGKHVCVLFVLYRNKPKQHRRRFLQVSKYLYIKVVLLTQNLSNVLFIAIDLVFLEDKGREYS